MPKLSVVVPTRERADTLLHTLRTLIDQDCADCEFIVSDNASVDDTRAVVASLNDPRLRYINTGKRVCMSENWEFALGHVKGEFVTYLGDDDGFIPGALSEALRLVVAMQVDALVWDKVEYCWPDYPDENRRNWFSMSTARPSLQMVNARRKLKMVMRFHEGYNRLPCLYNGIIRKSLLDKIAGLSTNQVFFNSISPDVYSGIALANVMDTYLHSSYPFSVNGASRHSNGTSIVRPQVAGEDSPAARFMSENWREYDERIKLGPSPSIFVMGEYLLAGQFLPSLKLSEPQWSAYVRALLRNAKTSLVPEAILDSARHTVSAVGLGMQIPERMITPANTALSLGMQGGAWSFKVPGTMVNNVHDACHLVAGMVSFPPSASAGSPWRRFVMNLARDVFSEAKILYRSY